MSGEFEKPVVPKEKLPRKSKLHVGTPEEEAECEGLLAEVEQITLNPAFDDDDDDVFFEALKSMLEMGRSERYRRHYRAVITTDFWKTFTLKHFDRIETAVPLIKAWDAARLEQKQQEASDAS